MENCLAPTGASIWLYVAVAFLLIVLPAGTFLLPGLRKGIFAAAIAFVALSIGTPVQAASGLATDCVAAAIPDTSNGLQGEVQVYNVLSNDTPSEGASFVLSSLRLALVSNPRTGSTVSNDNKTVTAPTEGVYVAGGNGRITYTPTPSFVGTARGVQYSIDDTAGETVTSTYKPVVTTTPVANNDALADFCVDGIGYANYHLHGDFTYCHGFGYSSGDPEFIIDRTDGTAQTVWTVQLLANDSATSPDPSTVDLNVSTSGVQQSVTGPGYTAVYNPGTDVLTVTITNEATLGLPGGYPPSEIDYDTYYGGADMRYPNANPLLLTYRFEDTYGNLSNTAQVTHSGFSPAVSFSAL